MKKFIVLLLVIFMLLTVAACGRQNPAVFTQLENPDFTHIMPGGVGFVIPDSWNYEFIYHDDRNFTHIFIDGNLLEIGINPPTDFHPTWNNPFRSLAYIFPQLIGGHGGEDAEIIEHNHGDLGHVVFSAEFIIPFVDTYIYSHSFLLADGYQYTYIFTNLLGDHAELGELIDELFDFIESIRFVQYPPPPPAPTPPPPPPEPEAVEYDGYEEEYEEYIPLQTEDSGDLRTPEPPPAPDVADAAPITEDLVGNWLWMGSLFYVFEADGTGLAGEDAIRWSASSGILSICTTPDSCGRICWAPMEWYYAFDGDKLTLTSTTMAEIEFSYTRG